MQKQNSVSYIGTGRRYRSHTMNVLNAVLTPGTPPNRLAAAAVVVATWHYRRRLMVLSLVYAILTRKR